MPKNRKLYYFRDKKEDHYGNWVYALINGGDIIYVGFSCGLKSRITQHRKDKIFDYVIAYKCREYVTAWFTETSAIRYIKPPLNKYGLGISRKNQTFPRYVKNQ